MFENFPYTDMHQLNLDWIIKIAKDFLDQYTHLQQLISDGEASLQNLTDEGVQTLVTKTDQLETLLNEWYATHSADIANQLAEALADLNAWYTQHQNYLDDTLAANIALFNNAADHKAAETIATIPDDYTMLQALADSNGDKYSALSPNMFDSARTLIKDKYLTDNGWSNNADPTNELGTTYPIFVREGKTYKCKAYYSSYGNNANSIGFVNPSDLTIITIIQGTRDANDMLTFTAPTDGYIVKDINTDLKGSFIFAESQYYPNEYTAYNMTALYPLQRAFINSIADKQLAISPNMFDKTRTMIRDKWMSDGGWNTNSDPTNELGTTYPIFVRKGTVYKCFAHSGTYGNNATWIAYVNPVTLAILGGSRGTLDTETDVVTWTATDDGFIVKDISMERLDTFIFAESKYFSHILYSGYKSTSEMLTDFIPNDAQNKTRFNILKMSPNLFDINSNRLIRDKWMNSTAWVPNANPGNDMGTTHPIHVHAGVTYKMPYYYNLYGYVSEYVTYVNPSTLARIDATRGTTDSTSGTMTWTAPRDGWVVVDIDYSKCQLHMFCPVNDYPNYFIPFNTDYLADTVELNPAKTKLGFKKLAADGDSIMEAAYDYPKRLKGWYGRLVAYSHMKGLENFAVGGGTITAGLYFDEQHQNPRHWICRSIQSVYNGYPDAEYVILTGGTNDADLIGRFIDDTPPQGFGKWSETDFSGSYDDTTFCGAVDTLFFKATTLFPNAKVGFIIEMEMGTGTASVVNRKRYFDEIVKIAHKWHVPVLNLWNDCPADARLTAYYDSSLSNDENVAAHKFYYDGQHPTSYGYDKMYNMVDAWLKTL